MKLLEHEAKSLLAACEIPVLISSFVYPESNAGPPSLAEQKLSIQKELYLSLSLNHATQGITFAAYTDSGTRAKDNSDFKLWNLEYDSFNVDVIGQELADYYQLPGQTFALQDLIENLYTCFVKNDATLIEINPLVLTTEDALVAGNCKITLDDAAAYRHDWQFEDQPVEANFSPIDPKENIGAIGSSAELSAATVISVPAPHAKDAILEAIDAETPLIICITKGIPVHDMLQIKKRLKDSSSTLVADSV